MKSPRFDRPQLPLHSQGHIDIPYPRNQETKMLPRFTELKNYIWQNVYKEYLEVQK